MKFLAPLCLGDFLNFLIPLVYYIIIIILYLQIISVYKYPEGKPITTMGTVRTDSSVDKKALSDTMSENRRLREKVIQVCFLVSLFLFICVLFC